MAYHVFRDSESGESFGSFEVFHAGNLEIEDSTPGTYLPAGWYWWACFPGCMPDGEAFGPFATEEEAIRDAQEGG